MVFLPYHLQELAASYLSAHVGTVEDVFGEVTLTVVETLDFLFDGACRKEMIYCDGVAGGTSDRNGNETDSD